jgi:hypothetical protein
MRIITLFSILSLITIPMAIHLGEGSNWLWNKSTEESSYGAIGVVYFFAFVIGGFAMTLRLYSMPDDQKESHDLHYNLIMGVATMLSVFCFSYLYAFTAAPVTSETGWLSGWMIYMVVGLLPVILNFNSVAGDMIERRRQRPTGEDKVRNIR